MAELENRSDSPAASLAEEAQISVSAMESGVSSPVEAVAISSRRHDLDALRAIAMLLGIVLHGLLAYTSLGWPVVDSKSFPAFDILYSAIHGFRMPLFFLISGFFTAMLWRKRGLGKLLIQRLIRIAAPLAIGCVVIVPASFISYIIFEVTKPDDANLWVASKSGRVDAVREFLNEGVSPNEVDPIQGSTPLIVASLYAHDEVVEVLLAADAEVDLRGRDGGTALHAAAFLGREEIVDSLLDAGADPWLRNQDGVLPDEAALADWGTTQFIAGMAGVPLNKADVERGRLSCLEQLSTAKELAPEADRIGETKRGAAPDQASGGFVGIYSKVIQNPLFSFPIFVHLWFLAFLCWLVGMFVVYALISDAVNFSGLPRAWVVSPLCFVWLIPLTLVPQLMMGWLIPVFGPDTSGGLLPMPHVLAYYAIFFFFGVLYFDGKDDEGALGRFWWITLPLALLVLLPIGMASTIGLLGFELRFGTGMLHSVVTGLIQVTFAWLMTVGSIGMFRACFHQESRVLRYLSDSSYWLYLMHMPLIVWVQWLMVEWPIPAFLKFLLVCLSTTGVLLVTYQLGVRYTPIGWLLNGKRKRHAPATVSNTSPSAS